MISNPVAILPIIASPIPNDNSIGHKDSEPCAEEAEEFSHESADIIEPSLDMTPMPSPKNDIFEYNVACTSTPLIRNLSNCETDNYYQWLY